MPSPHRSLVGWGRAALFGAVVLASSCGGPKGGTDVGNGATATFDLGKYHPNAAGEGAQDEVRSFTLANGMRVDAFWLSLSEVSLQQGQCGAKPPKDAVDHPLVGNFVQEDVLSKPSEALSLPGAKQCSVRIELDAVDAADLPADAPAELAGASLFVRGVLPDQTPFIVRSTSRQVFHVDAPKDRPIEVANQDPFMIAFDVEDAIMSLELAELDVEDGIVLIDDQHNNKGLAKLKKSIRSRAALFRDSDANGVLSADESTADRVLATGTLLEDQ